MIASSVASFLVWGWGGGGGERRGPKCTGEKIHVLNLLRNILFSGLQIHLYNTINTVSFYYFWYCAINDSIPTKNNIEENL